MPARLEGCKIMHAVFFLNSAKSWMKSNKNANSNEEWKQNKIDMLKSDWGCEQCAKGG